jgi:hypothetical protein
MFSFWQSLIPSGFPAKLGFKPATVDVVYGFNSDVDLTYTDDAGSTTRRRNGARMANKFSYLSALEGVKSPDTPINDGLRLDIQRPDGDVDINLFMENVRYLPGDKNYNMRVMTECATLGAFGKNCVSMLYNLLRLYYLYDNCDLEYDPDMVNYDNGHIKILNKGMFLGVKTKFSEAVEFVKTNVKLVGLGSGQAGANVEHTLYWDGLLSSKQQEVLSMALGQWTAKTPIGIGHSSPQLLQSIRLGNRFSDSASITRDNTPIDCFTIATVIDKLVTNNNLYTDFSYAYMMLVQILLQPKARTAESMVWSKLKYQVAMPLHDSRIYSVMGITSGPIYNRSADWRDDYLSWKNGSASAYFHSIVHNEAVYIELFNVTRSKGTDEINRLNFTTYSVNDALMASTGLGGDLVLLATRYGRELNIPYNVFCGQNKVEPFTSFRQAVVEIVMTDLDAPRHYNLADVNTELGTAKLIVTKLVPSVYPLLTFGINSLKYFGNAYKSEVTTNVDIDDDGDIYFSSDEEFANFMNIMRVMGYDVSGKSAHGDHIVSNWADNMTGRFLYGDLQLKGRGYIVNTSHIIRRDNYFIELGNFEGKVSLAISMGTLRYNIYGTDGKRINIRGSTIVGSKVLDSGRLEALVKQSAVLRFLPLHVTEQGFRLVRFGQPSRWDVIPPALPSRGAQETDTEEAEPVRPVTVEEVPRDD